MSTNYAQIVATLNRFAELAKTRPLTLGEALDSLDHAAFALIAMILALPYLQPVPMGPLTVLGGLTYAVMGWQLLRGHESPALPKRMRNVEMSERTWHILTKVCLKVVSLVKKFTRSRLTWFTHGVRGQMIGGLILLTAGLLMAIPFGVLPFNNTLPALAVLFYAFGQFEQDGLMVLISFLWLVVTALYFGYFFYLAWYFGAEAIQHMPSLW
ncbi:MAG TPA: exopolysaccharide biosynthesis protein [Methylophilaceae bacterium]|nr:exopolysaccharide biosynthesis protein [Methylophilaceae bacterium]